MTSLIILGAGGFGREVAGYAIETNRYQLLGFLDDTKPAGTPHAGSLVLGATDSPVDRDAHYLIAIADPAARHHMASKLTVRGATFAILIHPLAYVGANAVIGAGSIIAPFAFVGANARLGRQSIVNIYASIGHDAVLGDNVTMSPYASLQGFAQLGEESFVGAYAAVTAAVKVGTRARITAGAIIYNDMPAQARIIGNPARFTVEASEAMLDRP